MSVRIYQLSKELNMENKAVIALLQQRGLKVDSPSNTIPNIYADALLNEVKNKVHSTVTLAEAPSEPAAVSELEASPESEAISEDSLVEKTSEELPVEQPKIMNRPVAPKLPQGAIVRTAVDIAKEKEKKAPVVILPPSNIKKTTQAPLQTSNITRRPDNITQSPSPQSTPSAPQTNFAPSNQAPKLPNFPPRRQADQQLNKPGDVRLPEKEVPTLPTDAAALSNKVRIPSMPTTPPMRKEKISGELKIVQCKPPFVVRDFAVLIDVKPFRIISELMEMGIFASMNQVIDEAVAAKLAENHGYLLEIHHRGDTQPVVPVKKEKEEKVPVDKAENLEPRPPIVCVLGHVDHGKTSLLDAIRKTNVVAGEAGGITQHIGAYQVLHNGQKITFLDTPGHAAFSKMRERGASITDVAILVIAADDGFKPQTEEALKFAQKANVPVVVAINKMDAKGANIDNVYQQMQQRGIMPEIWGGEILATPISAIKRENLDKLLELVLLQAEMLDLKANPNCAAEGTVVESQIEVGKGPTATAIINRGTLKVGDALVCGDNFCKIKALLDDKGQRIQQATPATPVLIVGWSGAPDAGSNFQVVKNEKEAKQLAEDYAIEFKKRQAAEDSKLLKAATGTTNVDFLFAAIQQAKEKIFKVIIRADVNGSVEALTACLKAIKSSKIKLEVLSSEVGQITKGDIITANTSGSAIVAFNTRIDPTVQALAKHHNVHIIQHNIIYELITQVEDAMADMLEPELKENKLGAAQVRQVFTVGKGVVAGCMITEGKITKDKFARVYRTKIAGEPLYKGRINTLKRFKEDVTEVRAGYECGICVDDFQDIKEGDIIECFEIVKIKASLN